MCLHWQPLQSCLCWSSQRYSQPLQFLFTSYPSHWPPSCSGTSLCPFVLLLYGSCRTSGLLAILQGSSQSWSILLTIPVVILHIECVHANSNHIYSVKLSFKIIMVLSSPQNTCMPMYTHIQKWMRSHYCW